MIEFPCNFPIKVIYQNEPGASTELLAIFRRYHPDLPEDAIKIQSSKNNNFLSISTIIKAKDQASLDMLYRELTQNVYTKMVL